MTSAELDLTTLTTDPVGAAGRIGVLPETLANWRVQGRGPRFLKVGRRVRYRITDLAAFLDDCTRSSTSDDGSSA